MSVEALLVMCGWATAVYTGGLLITALLPDRALQRVVPVGVLALLVAITGAYLTIYRFRLEEPLLSILAMFVAGLALGVAGAVWHPRRDGEVNPGEPR
jgi:hypothetical protein